MRGQITLEYLIIALVILSLLSFSFFALIKIKESADSVYSVLIFKSDALSVMNSAANVCALGDGNSRTLFIKSTLNVSQYDDGVIALNSSDYSMLKALECRLSDVATDISGKITITNRDGEIVIKKVYDIS